MGSTYGNAANSLIIVYWLWFLLLILYVAFVCGSNSGSQESDIPGVLMNCSGLAVGYINQPNSDRLPGQVRPVANLPAVSGPVHTASRQTAHCSPAVQSRRQKTERLLSAKISSAAGAVLTDGVFAHKDMRECIDPRTDSRMSLSFGQGLNLTLVDKHFTISEATPGSGAGTESPLIDSQGNCFYQAMAELLSSRSGRSVSASDVRTSTVLHMVHHPPSLLSQELVTQISVRGGSSRMESSSWKEFCDVHAQLGAHAERIILLHAAAVFRTRIRVHYPSRLNRSLPWQFVDFSPSDVFSDKVSHQLLPDGTFSGGGDNGSIRDSGPRARRPSLKAQMAASDDSSSTSLDECLQKKLSVKPTSQARNGKGQAGGQFASKKAKRKAPRRQRCQETVDEHNHMVATDRFNKTIQKGIQQAERKAIAKFKKRMNIPRNIPPGDVSGDDPDGGCLDIPEDTVTKNLGFEYANRLKSLILPVASARASRMLFLEDLPVFVTKFQDCLYLEMPMPCFTKKLHNDWEKCQRAGLLMLEDSNDDEDNKSYRIRGRCDCSNCGKTLPRVRAHLHEQKDVLDTSTEADQQTCPHTWALFYLLTHWVVYPDGHLLGDADKILLAFRHFSTAEKIVTELGPGLDSSQSVHFDDIVDDIANHSFSTDDLKTKQMYGYTKNLPFQGSKFIVTLVSYPLASCKLICRAS